MSENIPMGRGSVVDPVEVPCWQPVKHHQGGIIPRVVCPNGHGGFIDAHTIDATGVVTPSVECPREGCGWHANIRLLGWKKER